MTSENTETQKDPYFLAYARVSTPSQSCENQIRIFTDLGIPRDRIYADEGVSGILPPNERPAYQSMKIHILNNKDRIKGVYVFQVSRLGREPLSTLQEMLWYLENHIQLIPTSESDRIYASLPDEFKPLLMGILTFLANMEREQLKQKIQAGIEVAKARGQKFGRKSKKPDFKKINELKEKYNWSTRAALHFTGTNENTYYKYLRLEKKEIKS